MGTSFSTPLHRAEVFNHPHAYGDKFIPQFNIFLFIGSSPRVWGQETIICVSPSSNRIIPTRMGTSGLKNKTKLMKKDHPHAYGDKLEFPFCPICKTGSSPRVWGQETAICGDILTDRIIPTRMGTRL